MAETIATGYIQLMPSTKGMKQAIENELKGTIEVPLAREAERAGASSGKALGTAMSRELQSSTAGMTRVIQQQTQQATGGLVASLKAAVAQYGGTKSVLAGVATQASSATQQLSGMVRGSGALATQTGAMKAGLLGVSGLLGGPWGIAIAGGSLALNAFAEAQQAAADRAKTLLDTLNAQTGKVTADTAASVAKSILQALDAADVTRLQALGISVQDATKAVLDSGSAFEQYRTQLEATGHEHVKATGEMDATVLSVRRLLGVLNVQHDALGDSQSDWSKTSDAQSVATKIAAQLTGQTNALGSALRSASGDYQVQITTNMATVINQAKAMLSLLAKVGGGGAQYSAGAALQDYIRSIESGSVVDPITAKASSKKTKTSTRRSSGGGSPSRATRSTTSSGSSARSALLELIGGTFTADLAGADRTGIGRTGNALAAAARNALSGARETAVTRLLSADTRRLQTLAGLRSSLATRLGDAQRDLTSLTEARSSTVSSVSQSAMGDLVGARSSAGVMRVLSRRLESVKAFRGNLATLARRGLPAAFLQQLVAAGLDGANTAAALVRSNDTDFATITTLTNSLSTESGGLGKDAGSILYDSGIASMQGLIRGMQTQEGALNAQMLKIAKSMQAAIKAALGIHSPSRVFADLGRQIPAGLAVGIDKGTPEVHRKVASMTPTNGGYQLSRPSAAAAAAASGPIQVYGVEDPVATATLVANELVWRNRR